MFTVAVGLFTWAYSFERLLPRTDLVQNEGMMAALVRMLNWENAVDRFTQFTKSWYSIRFTWSSNVAECKRLKDSSILLSFGALGFVICRLSNEGQLGDDGVLTHGHLTSFLKSSRPFYVQSGDLPEQAKALWCNLPADSRPLQLLR